MDECMTAFNDGLLWINGHVDFLHHHLRAWTHGHMHGVHHCQITTSIDPHVDMREGKNTWREKEGDQLKLQCNTTWLLCTRFPSRPQNRFLESQLQMFWTA